VSIDQGYTGPLPSWIGLQCRLQMNYKVQKRPWQKIARYAGPTSTSIKQGISAWPRDSDSDNTCKQLISSHSLLPYTIISFRFQFDLTTLTRTRLTYVVGNVKLFHSSATNALHQSKTAVSTQDCGRSEIACFCLLLDNLTLSSCALTVRQLHSLHSAWRYWLRTLEAPQHQIEVSPGPESKNPSVLADRINPPLCSIYSAILNKGVITLPSLLPTLFSSLSCSTWTG
jgi:hypothetical protein